ncbi:hypothetical protein JKF63_07720 [Porcisia hertigi]|uniref:DDRGK domain-containing protein 1 n=1 Tax=Porcisia hertigi TaxID=2761500 RepID=A0A836LLS8_9TRYP|nr:hypothetical protein JKF63_07720 [Porcisia hertigi]
MSVASPVLALLLVGVVGALLLLLLQWISQRHANERRLRSAQNASGASAHRPVNDTADDENGAPGGRRMGATEALRRRRRHLQHDADPRHGDNGGDARNDDGDDTGDIPEMDENGVRLTRLQRKKHLKEREREERRRAQEAALEAERQRVGENEFRDAEASLREEERKAAEEAALQQLREDKKRADDDEYAKWVSHIGVEERGELGDEKRERQARVQSFLLDRAAQVQARAQRSVGETEHRVSAAGTSGSDVHEEDCLNLLVLQTAARDLGVSVKELVCTIEHLSQTNQVHGVFDDRGKYVFIAPEHFLLLAEFIQRRGRVSLQEFTRECNRIVMQS